MRKLKSEIRKTTFQYQETDLENSLNYFNTIQNLCLKHNYEVNVDYEVIPLFQSNIKRVLKTSMARFLQKKMNDNIQIIKQELNVDNITQIIEKINFIVGSMTDQMHDDSFEESCKYLKKKADFEKWYNNIEFLLSSNTDDNINNAALKPALIEENEDLSGFKYIICVCTLSDVNSRVALADNDLISMVWNFHKEYKIDIGDISTVAYVDSADGDEYIQDQKHIATLVKGYAGYWGCDAFKIGFRINNEFYQDLSKNLDNSFNNHGINISKIQINYTGIEIHVNFSTSFIESGELQKFKNTDSFGKLHNYFKKITNQVPDTIILPQKKFDNIEWEAGVKVKLDSLTNLIKKHNISISAIKFNKLLVLKQILEERQRSSRSDSKKIKKFKAFTDKGLKYGINKTNPHNDEEVSPQYYTNTFSKLIKYIETSTETKIMKKEKAELPELQEYLVPSKVEHWESIFFSKPISFSRMSWDFIAVLDLDSDNKYRRLSGAEKTPIAEAYINNGVDINFVSYEGYTALFYAIYMCSLDLVKWCISRGANVNQIKKKSEQDVTWKGSGNKDFSAFMFCCGLDYDPNEDITQSKMLKRKEIAEYLLKMGADPLYATKGKRTALTISKKLPSLEIHNYLKPIFNKSKQERKLPMNKPYVPTRYIPD